MRNDDSPLFRGREGENRDTTRLFRRGAGMAERETPLARFERLFSGKSSEAECRAMLRSEDKVWTWIRLRAFAEAHGYDAKDMLGLWNDLRLKKGGMLGAFPVTSVEKAREKAASVQNGLTPQTNTC